MPDNLAACQSQRLVKSIVHALVGFGHDAKVGVLFQDIHGPVGGAAVYDNMLHIRVVLVARVLDRFS